MGQALRKWTTMASIYGFPAGEAWVGCNTHRMLLRPVDTCCLSVGCKRDANAQRHGKIRWLLGLTLNHTGEVIWGPEKVDCRGGSAINPTVITVGGTTDRSQAMIWFVKGPVELNHGNDWYRTTGVTMKNTLYNNNNKKKHFCVPRLCLCKSQMMRKSSKVLKGKVIPRIKNIHISSYLWYIYPSRLLWCELLSFGDMSAFCWTQ